MRNRIINGDMRIDQRNAGASITPLDGQFSVDRWACFRSQASRYSVQQNAGSVTPPPGFTNYLGATSLSAYSSVASDYFGISQSIEGLNVADLAFGTANAQSVTLSFWVRSSLTGTLGGSLRNSAINRSYVFSYTVSAANAWEYKTITIPGDTAGTWFTNNGLGINVWFDLGSGSTATAAAGSWSASNAIRPTGSVSLVGTNGATFYVTGVQLEPGTVATPFERRMFGNELALCQRYYSVINMNAQSTGTGFSVTPFYGPVTMRITPILTQLSAGSASNATITGVTANTNQPAGFFQINSSAASGSVVNASYAASAEL